MAKVLRKMYTDGRVEFCEEQMELKQLQEFVGGWIEFVPTTDPKRLLCINEEGLIYNLPPNAEATRIVRGDVMVSGGGIRGNALVVEDNNEL